MLILTTCVPTVGPLCHRHGIIIRFGILGSRVCSTDKRVFFCFLCLTIFGTGLQDGSGIGSCQPPRKTLLSYNL